ncbi:MAG TPA: hypothetical protein VNA89_13700 [Gemmatimonadaceae bacterium]|nr:hypothetical protein [Gemmatimonadaceae bacterium]
MSDQPNSSPERPDPAHTPEPSPEPRVDPSPAPGHDPGPPVRKVTLPPDSPSPGIPVENPERPGDRRA